MADDLKKDSIDDEKWNLNNSDDNLDNLNLDDFSKELDELESGIEEAMNKKSEKAKNIVLKETKSELDGIKSEIGSDGNLDPEWESFTEEEKKNVSEFFVQWRKEFEKIDSDDEDKVVKKYKSYKPNKNNRIVGRSVEVQKSIMESVDLIVDEINDRKRERNPVAKSLLRIVDFIMKTEK